MRNKKICEKVRDAKDIEINNEMIYRVSLFPNSYKS